MITPTEQSAEMAKSGSVVLPNRFECATSLCNKLSKINPPPFITLPNSTDETSPNSRDVKNSSKQAFMQLHKLYLSIESKKEMMMVHYFAKEIDLLNGFIERKGAQLRLEKALQLSNQILKVGMRWKSNEFFPQMQRFVQSGIQNSKDTKPARLPSRQWAQWIVYLCLRESALLVKIKLECEKATKFWLGLISSSHHWGDSLVVTGILSRIWRLCLGIFESLSKEIYPSLHKLVKLLKPSNAPSWPSNEFEMPSDLICWLHNEMNLRYENNNSRELVIEDNQHISESNYSFIKELKKKDKSKEISHVFPKSLDDIGDNHGNNDHRENEDLGVLVICTNSSKSNENLRKKKGAIGTANKLCEWSVLFKNYKKFLNTGRGRKKIFAKIKKRLASQTNEKIKLKLRNILRSVNNGDTEKMVNMIEKFLTYIART